VSKLKKEDGYAVVLAFIMLLVLMIILTAVFSLVSNEIKFVSHARDSIKTFYIAEAGLEYASSFLSSLDLSDDSIWNDTDDDGYKELTDLSEVNGIVTNKKLDSVVITNINNNEITLKSTAIHDNGLKKEITVTYDKISNGSDFTNYSLVANGNIDLKNKVIIEGVVDDDHLDLDGDGIINKDDPDANNDGIEDPVNSIIEYEDEETGVISYYDTTPDYYGDIYTTGFVTEKNNTNLINSSVKDLSTNDDLQDIVPDMYASVSSQYEDEIDDSDGSNGTFYKNTIPQNSEGEYDFDDDVDVVYSDTDLEFKNGDIIKGNGILLVNGNIDFKNGVNISTADNENLIIIANGDVTFNNSSDFSGMVYASGKIYIKAKVDVQGSLISKTAIEETTISINNGGNDPSKIVYDNSYLKIFENLGIELPTIENEFGYDLEIVSWQE
jgi:Tfp pilus assembly protein PilX